jgi:hypothetical protein
VQKEQRLKNFGSIIEANTISSQDIFIILQEGRCHQEVADKSFEFLLLHNLMIWLFFNLTSISYVRLCNLTQLMYFSFFALFFGSARTTSVDRFAVAG